MIPSRAPILFLSRCGQIDGLQRQLLYLVSEMDRERHPVTVVVSEPGPLQEVLLEKGVEALAMPMRPWRSFPRALWRYADAWRLAKAARAREIRLVHAHDVWWAEYARFVARRLGVPYVVHVRVPLAPRDIRKHRLGLADGVIAIAQRYADDLAAAGVARERIALVDDAVDLKLFLPDGAGPNVFRERHGVTGSPIVGLVGRISAFKRVLEFLDMAVALPRRPGDRTQFVVVGDWAESDYRARVEQAVDRLNLRERVRFMGRCDSRDMPRVLGALDVLVTLSGGSVMFEAMACGVPVLSVRTDGRHSQHTRHDETAWCVTADRPEPAAAGLDRLIQDGALRRRLGAAGRAWVQSHLSTATMAARTQELYARLLAARTGGRASG